MACRGWCRCGCRARTAGRKKSRKRSWRPRRLPRGDNKAMRLALLWLAGISLRVTVLAIPPVIPAIHNDMALNEKAVGTLTSLPVLLLAAAAVLGSLVIHRLG